MRALWRTVHGFVRQPKQGANWCLSPCLPPPPPSPLIPHIISCGSHFRPALPQARASLPPLSSTALRGVAAPLLYCQRVKNSIQEGVASIYPCLLPYANPISCYPPPKHRQAGLGGRTFQGGFPRSGASVRRLCARCAWSSTFAPPEPPLPPPPLAPSPSLPPSKPTPASACRSTRTK